MFSRRGFRCFRNPSNIRLFPKLPTHYGTKRSPNRKEGALLFPNCAGPAGLAPERLLRSIGVTVPH
jgi:hypothetical protein